MRETRELFGKMDELPDAKTLAFTLVDVVKENFTFAMQPCV